MPGVAVAWTGGKDSCLAFYEAERLGYKADCLVTFAWSQETFLAPPLNFISLQAEALELPHHKLDIAEPFDQGYEDVFSLLKEQHDIGVLITGDIGEVAGHDPNWLVERAAHSSVEVIRPLWHMSRIRLLNRLLELGFRVVFSCVKTPWFTDEWLGKELSATTIQQLIEIDQRIGLDICGEQGEYHTLAIDGPQFRKRIRIESYSKHVHDSIMYICLEGIQLERRIEQ
jgi:diphthine-ammonia ligase